MDDLLNEFLTETNESLEILDTELVRFEQDPGDVEILGNIFRLMHTIKGTCGFLGLPRLETVAHAGENVLGNFRDGNTDVTPEAVTSILTCIDRIRELLTGLEETGKEPEQGDDNELVSKLNAIAGGKGGPEIASNEAAEPAANDGPSSNAFGAPVAAELLAELAAAEGNVAESTDTAADAEPVEVEDAPAETASEDSEPEQPAAEVASDKPAEAKPAKEAPVTNSSIRVNVEVLENLMTLVSELVLTRNQLLQMVRGTDESEFSAPLQRLSHITTDLQEGVMKTRMQPIGNAWSKLPRIVRDLAIETGKKIDLRMSGQDTELDRQVLELIKDPLTHMVRNSADHGLEPPSDRQAAKKPETGVIDLCAFHEGGHIIITISDDGRGLNTDAIRKKIIDRGLASKADVDAMDDRQVQQHIFKAGFSTAEKVTSVSGRGVGMDVVRTNIESIGGTVELRSTAGKGSTFTIKIPLTLAIVSALVVACGPERFAIPQLNVLELVRSGANSEHTIESINDTPVLRLRDRLLPLISLRKLLEINDDDDQPDTKDLADENAIAVVNDNNSAPVDHFIVVTQVGSNTFGIIVDRVFDTEEIVVKPVAPILRDIPFYSGNTILGDGSVIMILDPNGVSSAIGQGASANQMSQSDDHKNEDFSESSSFLVFKAGDRQRMAIPLGLIARLEEIDASKIENADGKPIVQYRNSLMPLLTVNNSQQIPSSDTQAVIVFADGERSMGLAVDEIVDIVDDKLDTELQSETGNLLGTAVLDGVVTDIIDVSYYLTKAFSDWFENPQQRKGAGDSKGRRLLLVDDSQFFRDLIAPYLSVEGYQVTTSINAVEALKLREQGVNFDIIISDIEMPEMSGFEFAEAIRRDGAWQHVPILALSSTAEPAHVEKGKAAGFFDFISKTNRTDLLGALARAIDIQKEAA